MIRIDKESLEHMTKEEFLGKEEAHINDYVKESLEKYAAWGWIHPPVSAKANGDKYNIELRLECVRMMNGNIVDAQALYDFVLGKNDQ